MKLSSTFIALALAAVSFASPAARAGSGYVQTSGQAFTLDGAPYTVYGENSYWVGLSGYSTDQMNQAFSDIAATGGTTVRTWGFNDVNSTTASDHPVYYQYFDGKNITVNTGANGLANFDNVVAAAKANNIKLIVTLTNNWGDYGGMDVYVNSILGYGQPHDYFYSNPDVIAAYKNYVKAFVSRYANEPTIFGWELANEPRCGGSTPASSGTCTTKTITTWIQDISSYIKTVDSNHLVGLGDEGWFNWANSTSDWTSNGSNGIDFDANLAISSIDFGTFHLYPGTWQESSPSYDQWGQTWIQNHRNSQVTANKPVLLEEFGVTVSQDQTQTYNDWYSTAINGGLSGVIIWQAGSNYSSGNSPDDGFTVYPGTDAYNVVKTFSAEIKKRDGTS
ncbi:hypothetical protein CONPUDRAFT_180574 [Coniophora puteana RWD-64-598 SS2]|uniref:mannan endo-1,4-beta-mannosidase n=1 Tax=Coniophora puteana (strain RWD-64-598) TaxID=741705 RepID=A0A5M3M9Z1_CONPW|nr:uncharacterized protein CONPUDRAFT_180574 [Coniophora puteana RWD-64-598 SS2]EIW75756.1 hypothetical protein CONPUDRAFT_180574 [Coniophora puteana RWD-64-598 SS2]